MKLETKEEYLVDSAIEMLYPTVTFNSYEAAVKHIHETPGTWRITKSIAPYQSARKSRRQTMSYKAKIFTREEFREVVAAAIYDYEQAPAKCLYTTKDAADQLYGHYGEETEVEE